MRSANLRCGSPEPIPASAPRQAEEYKTVSDVSPDLVPHLPSEDYEKPRCNTGAVRRFSNCTARGNYQAEILASSSLGSRST
jgi:hypothetical protein